MISLIKLRILCILLLFTLLLPASAIARQNLFDISDKPQTPVNKLQFSVDNSKSTGKETITLNSRLLSSKAGDELDFVSLSGTVYTVVFDKLRKGNRAKTWIGHLKDYGLQYRVILTLNKNTVEGRLATPEGTLHIKSSKGEVILMDYELQGMHKMPFGDDALLPQDEALLSATTELLSYEQDSVSLAAASTTVNGNTIVDVLVLYNADFESLNNNDAMTRIDHLAALSNQAYLDSQAAMQIRVVAAELIDYSNLTSNNEALDAISGTSTLANDIAALRNQTGADLVILIRPYQQSAHGGCGIAMLNKYMNSAHIFAVVSDGVDIDYSGDGSYFYCTDDAFAHELGHTMGLAHDLAHSGGVSGHYEYSYGYGTDELFGTIMSYTSPAVSLFSNPDISDCNNYICGSATADNARSLNNDKDIISGFRDEVISHTIPLNGMYYLLLH